MPHVIMKLWPGRTEEQKKRLANEIVKDIVSIAGCEEKFVSVAFEEIAPDEWAEKVYKPVFSARRRRCTRNQGTIRAGEDVLA